jgi:hypothetical protein
MLSLRLKYLHCVRDPIACARSNWDMPWDLDTDTDAWIAHALGRSATAFAANRESGKSFILSTPMRSRAPTGAMTALVAPARFLSVELNEEMGQAATAKFDPWPRERRRSPPVFSTHEHAEKLEARHDTRRWRQTFPEV